MNTDTLEATVREAIIAELTHVQAVALDGPEAVTAYCDRRMAEPEAETCSRQAAGEPGQ